MQLLYIALGGALGAVCRFLLSNAVNQRFASAGGFPIGTLAVNGIGSFLIGALFVVLNHYATGQAVSDQLRSLIIVGVLGGFTTFSTFSLETLQLIEAGLWSKALLNIILSVLLCILAAAAGVAVTKWAT